MHPLPSLARREKCNEKRSMWLAVWPCKTCQHLSFYRSGRRSCYQFFLDSPGRKLFPILSYLFKRRWSPMFIMFYGSLNMVLTWDCLILQYPIKYSEFQCSEIESFKLEMFKWIRSQVGCCQTVRQRIRHCSFACMSHSFSWKLWLASNLILFILRRKCWVISSMKGKRTWLKICQNDPLQNFCCLLSDETKIFRLTFLIRSDTQSIRWPLEVHSDLNQSFCVQKIFSI